MALTVQTHIFTTLICQIAQCPEAKGNQFWIEWIELAEGGNIQDGVSQKSNCALKWAV
jgi:hypothetical protein